MKKSLFSVLAMSLSLFACGGGGGGDTTPVPTQAVKIDSNNAEAITAVAYDSAMMVADQRSFTDFTLRSSSESNSALASSLLGATKLGLSHLPTAQTIQSRASTITEPCDSGSITITIGSDDGVLDQPGEYLSLNFNSCVIAGDSFSGSLRMTIKSWVSDFNFVMETSINLNTVVDGLAVSSNGSMEVGLMDSGTTTTFTLSSSSMSGTVGTETTTMTNLNVVVTETSTGYTSDMSMNIASNTIGGSVNIDTNPALEYGTFDTYPSTGTLTVTGADGTYVSLNADTGDMNTVIITIFDGAATISNEIPWSQLDTNF